MKKIIIDTLGGDNGEEEIVRGVIEASKIYSDYSFVLVGSYVNISNILAKCDVDKSRFEIVNAPSSISNSDDPRLVVRGKENCSMASSFNILKLDKEAVGMISSGSTGALLVGTIFKLGLFRGVNFPALSSLLFSIKGEYICLVDCGANIDVNRVQLLSFAKMGVALLKSYCGIENPRVGLLNVGVEEGKGNRLLKEAYPLFKTSSLNFIGNIEGNDIFLGGVDVIACDGFAGNIVLKNAESVAMIAANIVNKTLGDEGKPAIDEIHRLFAYNEQGGAIVLGSRKMVIKAHGAATKNTIVSVIGDMIKMDKGDFIQNLRKTLGDI